MGVHKANSGSFSSTNQPKNRRGSSSKTKMLKAFKMESYSETEFWQHVIKSARNGEQACITILANRLVPPLKAAQQPISALPLPDDIAHYSRTAIASLLVQLAMEGKMSIEDSLQLINGLKNINDIQSSEIESHRLDEVCKILGIDEESKGSAVQIAAVKSEVVAEIDRLKAFENSEALIKDEPNQDQDQSITDTENDKDADTGDLFDE